MSEKSARKSRRMVVKDIIIVIDKGEAEPEEVHLAPQKVMINDRETGKPIFNFVIEG